jgi:hypothetical protein
MGFSPSKFNYFKRRGRAGIARDKEGEQEQKRNRER